MPTTIPLGFRDVNVELVQSVSATMSTPDFVIVAVFSGVGLLLSVAFALLFPLSQSGAALLLSVS